MTSYNNNHGPLNNHYIEKMKTVIGNAVQDHHRTMAVVMLLRLPDHVNDIGDIPAMFNYSQGIMSRFIESLNAKIASLMSKKKKQNIRTHPCHLRYSWVREYCQNGKPHYHAVIYVNKDSFHSLGDYMQISDNLGSLIREAWLSALNLIGHNEYLSLVHFPETPLYYLNVNESQYTQVFNGLMYRLSYFAKDKSKSYCKEQRSFGCSQR
ncbi:inovirus Gp2 family protein [Pectobacterium polaris]|uniref:inovirus Gp2 family protein n=1 Tax=Pectobacterium polaris TaxID=2042057 RepID=UPI0023AF3DBB|nr:inovirus Gp2 family protein [Pectobacterium polaris]MDE8754074.1 inovirus Gp2 family protein [Pectobacterium polaris]